MTDPVALVPGADTLLRPADPGAHPCAHPGARGTRNLLLNHMEHDDYALLRPHIEPASLSVGTVLARVGEPIDTICFLDGGLAGFLDVLGDGQRLVIGVIGREGVVGWPALMGNDQWPYDVEVRATCDAQRVPIAALLAATAVSARLNMLLLRFAGIFAAQMGDHRFQPNPFGRATHGALDPALSRPGRAQRNHHDA
jgi:CRP-like cAMP-binding protein